MHRLIRLALISALAIGGLSACGHSAPAPTPQPSVAVSVPSDKCPTAATITPPDNATNRTMDKVITSTARAMEQMLHISAVRYAGGAQPNEGWFGEYCWRGDNASSVFQISVRHNLPSNEWTIDTQGCSAVKPVGGYARTVGTSCPLSTDQTYMIAKIELGNKAHENYALVITLPVAAPQDLADKTLAIAARQVQQVKHS